MFTLIFKDIKKGTDASIIPKIKEKEEHRLKAIVQNKKGVILSLKNYPLLYLRPNLTLYFFS